MITCNDMVDMSAVKVKGPLCVFRQEFTLEDAIGSHVCSLQASKRVTDGIPLG